MKKLNSENPMFCIPDEIVLLFNKTDHFKNPNISGTVANHMWLFCLTMLLAVGLIYRNISNIPFFLSSLYCSAVLKCAGIDLLQIFKDLGGSEKEGALKEPNSAYFT
jgi:hypothetical protein